MKWRGAIPALAVSNLVLIGVVAWQMHLLRQHRFVPGQAGSLSSSRPWDSVDDAALRMAASAQNSAQAGSTTSPSSTNWPKFDWRRVESEDYETYVKNLRDIGCPPETIRDIVTADVLQAYAGRRAETAATVYKDFKFWDGTGETYRQAHLARQRAILDQQMNDVLQQLLGSEASSPDTSREWRAAELEQRLAFLPADKRAKAVSLLLASPDLDAKCYFSPDANWAAEHREALSRGLQQFEATRAKLTQMLTPEEYELLDMSASWTGDNVRRGTTGFRPTEEEFRAIYREWRNQDELVVRQCATGQPDPGKELVFERIRALLGDQRYAEYRAAW